VVSSYLPSAPSRHGAVSSACCWQRGPDSFPSGSARRLRAPGRLIEFGEVVRLAQLAAAQLSLGRAVRLVSASLTNILRDIWRAWRCIGRLVLVLGSRLRAEIALGATCGARPTGRPTSANPTYFAASDRHSCAKRSAFAALGLGAGLTWPDGAYCVGSRLAPQTVASRDFVVRFR